nr:DUF2079 domain-containing protein [Oscillatoria sp. FACHB-1406]
MSASQASKTIQESNRQRKELIVERQQNSLIAAIALFGLLLFACSSLKHALYRSTAADLGIFDQAIYLISQGKTPISSLLGFHILGDHAAFIYYPIALLYKLYPSVYWLFALQAIALSSAALLASNLALDAGLPRSQSRLVAFAYLFYPLIFNINLFDFHPDVFVPFGLFAAVLSARRGKIIGFCAAIALILSCKAVLSLTVAAMGVWLFACEKKRLYGAIAFCAGIAWFAIATQIIIPTFGGAGATLGRHLWRYAYLGSSFNEIFQNFLFKPQLLLGQIFSFDSLRYLLLLVLPLLWGLSPRRLAPLIAAIPALCLNLLADDPNQRDLYYQYSLPVLPFLILSVIATLAAGEGLRLRRKTVMLWCAIAFFAFAKHYYILRFLSTFDTWTATTQAMSAIPPNASVLTDNELAPHLTHRPTLKLINTPLSEAELGAFDFVLIDLRRPWPDHVALAQQRVAYFRQQPNFNLVSQRDEIYLFARKPQSSSILR